jgi:hypothetical protein
MRSYLEKSHHKQGAGAVAQCVGPEFKSQCFKKIFLKEHRISKKKEKSDELSQSDHDKEKMEETMNVTYWISLTPFKDHSCMQS